MLPSLPGNHSNSNPNHLHRHVGDGDCLCLLCHNHRTKLPLPTPPPAGILPNLFLFAQHEIARLHFMVHLRDKALAYVGGEHDGAEKYPHFV